MKKIILITALMAAGFSSVNAIEPFQRNYLKINVGYGKMAKAMPSVLSFKKASSMVYSLAVGTYLTNNFRTEIGAYSVNKLRKSDSKHRYKFVGYGGALNFFYDINVGSIIVPFIGAGVNYTFIKNYYTDFNTSSNSSKGNNLRLGYNLNAGFSVSMNQSWKLDFSYQYQNLGKLKSPKFGSPKQKPTLSMNTGMIGLRYSF